MVDLGLYLLLGCGVGGEGEGLVEGFAGGSGISGDAQISGGLLVPLDGAGFDLAFLVGGEENGIAEFFVGVSPEFVADAGGGGVCALIHESFGIEGEGVGVAGGEGVADHALGFGWLRLV
ncbi:hypothetical protein CCB80_01115 [Armatimonadetes bacterium Uphvl-Ar1]|nr:hypothetical protein CCB80_01115 [Armatimonadetes bacterium Uphvl-Ar1]